MSLERYGWDQHFQQQLEHLAQRNEKPARVLLEIKNHFRVFTEEGEVPAHAAGRMFFQADSKTDLPVVGDWVLMKLKRNPEPMGTIRRILPRKSLFVRRMPGRQVREQPVAANIDTVFIITGLDGNFSLRRIERYLTLTWESGARPVIILNKKDLVPEDDERPHQAEEIAMDVPVHVISALYRQGLEQLEPYLPPGGTVAMLGSSGVGKSTLLNSLHGEEIQEVRDIGAAGKGVHTTRTRELFMLPSGAMLIDTPGMREIQLWSTGEGLDEAFPEIEDAAQHCRFNDCTHMHEPGCAVKEAVDAGNIPRERYDNYVKMQAELRSLEARQDTKAMLEKKAAGKRLHKIIRRFRKN